MNGRGGAVTRTPAATGNGEIFRTKRYPSSSPHSYCNGVESMKHSALARRTITLGASLSLAIVLWHSCSTIALGQSRYTDAASTSMFSIGVGVAPGISLPIGTLD